VMANTRPALEKAFIHIAHEAREEVRVCSCKADAATVVRLRKLRVQQAQRLDRFLANGTLSDFRLWLIETRVPGLFRISVRDVAKLVTAYLEHVDPKAIEESWGNTLDSQ